METKSKLIEWVENYLENFALGPAIEKSTIQGPRYTSDDVWGAEVILDRKISDDKCEVIAHKLRTYTAQVEFTEDEVRFLTDYCSRTELVDMVAHELYKQNLKMFGSVEILKLSADERAKYTCEQLGEWNWLEYDGRTILREKKSESGDIVYCATLKKYAIVLDENGDPVCN